MAERLCDRLDAAPVLPARAKAEALLARELIERLHDEAAAEALKVHFAGHPHSAVLVAGVLAHSPFLTQVMRFDPEALFACLTQDVIGREARRHVGRRRERGRHRLDIPDATDIGKRDQ